MSTLIPKNTGDIISIADAKEIDKIIFGVYSAQEIIDMAVCKIDNTKMSGYGSVYDPRMGCSLDSNDTCETCGELPKTCTGHFSFVELNEDIFHPLFMKMIVAFRRCFCIQIQCNRLLLTKDQISLYGFDRYKNELRFNKILEKIEKIDICSHCQHSQPQIAHNITDNNISMVYKEKSEKKDREKDKDKEPEIVEQEQDDDADFGPHTKKKESKDTKISIIIEVDEIKKSFESILDEDVILCGFDPKKVHPRNFIISVFPVIPPCARPPVIADGNICDDDLTNQILEIIKVNNILLDKEDDSKESDKDDEKRETKKQKALQTLKFRISTFYNNSSGKAKHPTNGRPIKGIKERLTGKEGLLRNNLMGKRVEFSARSVISPDPNLPFGWIGLPHEVAEELTYPEIVATFNIDYLTKLVNDGKANFVIKKNEVRINLKYAMLRKGTELLYNDVIIRGGQRITITNTNAILRYGDNIERNGEILDNITYPTKKTIILEIGDTVFRHLKDGDIVLFNRQPTLWKGSMMGFKTKILPGKTFRMNLPGCKNMNADFDGFKLIKILV